MVKESDTLDIAKEQQFDVNEYKELIDKIERGDFHLSYSSIREFAQSPKHFIKYKLRKFTQTPAMLQGNILDCLLTTPDDFDKEYVVSDFVKPGGLGGQVCEMMLTGISLDAAVTSLYKKKPTSKSLDAIVAYVDFKSSVKDKTVISQDECDLAERKKDALYKNFASKKILLSTTHTQVKAEFEFQGFNWKGYLDGKGEGMIWDLKNMGRGVSPREVKYAIRDKKYDWQQALYGISQTGHFAHYVLAIDNACNICVIEFEEDHIRRAKAEIKECVKQFKKCIVKNAWGASYDFHTPFGIYSYGEI